MYPTFYYLIITKDDRKRFTFFEVELDRSRSIYDLEYWSFSNIDIVSFDINLETNTRISPQVSTDIDITYTPGNKPSRFPKIGNFQRFLGRYHVFPKLDYNFIRNSHSQFPKFFRKNGNFAHIL